MLGALDQPNEGTVLFDSVDLYSLGEREVTQFRGRSIGFVFQFHHLLAEFSAQENVAMPLLVAGASEVEALNAARELLDQMELLDRLNHLPSQLSGGEQQRVAIARALVNHPRLILADEPTGNLDLKTGREIEDLLCRAQQTRQASLIVVTHQRDLAQRMDYVLEMRPGGELVCIQGEGR